MTFKVIGRYVYPQLESTDTFKTYSKALTELRKWKRSAKSQGLEVTGRVVSTKPKKKRI